MVGVCCPAVAKVGDCCSESPGRGSDCRDAESISADTAMKEHTKLINFTPRRQA